MNLHGVERKPLREPEDFLPVLQALHRSIRATVTAACRSQQAERLSQVASDEAGDTIYAIDQIAESRLVSALESVAADASGIVLVAEGLRGGRITLPLGMREIDAKFLVIVDPIDGTRGLMYQKRSGWILTGVARYRGPSTSLSDVELALQTELPLVKQYLADELWAIRGRGARAQRVNVLDGSTEELTLTPSRSTTIEHGYSTISRFFPGGRDELAGLDDELVASVLGPNRLGKALCFEDQYASTGGQLYELMNGHDRFIADLRPLLAAHLRERGIVQGLCCHPYDICTALIASELGVVLTLPNGAPLDVPLNLEADVGWVGYANSAIQRLLQPTLERALQKRSWLAERDG